MKIEVKDTIDHPVDVVFTKYRDNLEELVEFLPNIEEIKVSSRTDKEGGITELINLWKAKAKLPKIAQKIIKPHMLCWEDHVTWTEKEYRCDWTIIPAVFTDSIVCKGSDIFRAKGENSTEVCIEGSFELKREPDTVFKWTFPILLFIRGNWVFEHPQMSILLFNKIRVLSKRMSGPRKTLRASHPQIAGQKRNSGD